MADSSHMGNIVTDDHKWALNVLSMIVKCKRPADMERKDEEAWRRGKMDAFNILSNCMDFPAELKNLLSDIYINLN